MDRWLGAELGITMVLHTWGQNLRQHVHVHCIVTGGGSHEFECLETALRAHDWVVYTKAPFAGAEHVLAYLGRYTHKTAIGNHRLIDFAGEHVRFRWCDYADSDKVKVMRLDADEFNRRFLLHVLPRGFTRLRHYGLLANRCRARKLALCRDLLGQQIPEPREPETPEQIMLRLTGIDITGDYILD